MNKVHAMLILVVGTLLVVAFLPLIMDSISGVQYPETIESFTAVELLASPEAFDVSKDIEAINYVTVNGIELADDQHSALDHDTVLVLANNSDVGDEIVISYTYEDTSVESAVNMLYILPFLIVIVVVVYYIKFK